jgi:hypothetical protein
MGNEARAMLRDRIRADPFMPKALEFLRAKGLRDIGDALGGVDLRNLVDLRYHLADAFVQQMRTMQGDRPKPNRTKRREALERLVQKTQALKEEAECNLPWLRDEHHAASFFGASGPNPSLFDHDYARLFDAITRLEGIAAAILSVPPIGRGRTTSPYLEGFPSDRLENPGTWARVAFARRLGQIYHDLTGKMPGVTKEQDGPYQRMVAVASAAFLRAYKDADQPFGSWRPPSRDDVQKACKSIGRKST